MRDRLLMGVVVLLAVSVVVTGGLAVVLTLERRRAGGDVEEAERPSQIAYVSDQEGEMAVYVMEADGANSRRISEEGWRAVFPAWSPDGTRLAYLSWREEDEDAVVVVATVDGAERIRVSGTVTGVTGLPPTWSPDGARLAFLSAGDLTPGSAIYIAWADGSGVERSIPLPEFVVTDLKWSPAGDELLLLGAPAGGEEGVYRLSVENGEVERSMGRVGAADWSPDGEAVAVAAYSTHTLYVVCGEGEMEEVAQVMGNPEEVAWSPDGKHIALTTSHGRVGDFGQALSVVEVGTGRMVSVVEGEGWVVWPRWSPGGGQLLFTMGPMRRRPGSDLPYADLWVYDLASGQLKQLTFEEGFEGLGVWGRGGGRTTTNAQASHRRSS